MASQKSADTAAPTAASGRPRPPGLDQALEIAAANAVAAEQEAMMTRQGAVAAAAAAILELFAAGGAGDASEAAAKVAESAVAEPAAGTGAGSNAPREGLVSFSASLAVLDAGNVLAGVGTLATLLSALALTRYVATGEARFLQAQQAADRMLREAIGNYELMVDYASPRG